MSEHSHISPPDQPIEDVLQEELAHGDAVMATARPVLRHLLTNDAGALFTDEVLANVRGMLAGLAREMIGALAAELGEADPEELAAIHAEDIAQAMLRDADLLAHAHALTVESRLAERLRERNSIDPVLTPLMQELTASPDGALAATAMRALTAQARFLQAQRRMQVQLAELPEAQFSAAIGHFRDRLGDHREAANAVVGRLRESYSPGKRRTALLGELVAGLRHRAGRALDINNAGISLFVTALAIATDEPRETAIFALGENQCARLALSLRAAGVSAEAVEEQFLYLHPEITLPEGLGSITPARAAAILTDARRAAAET